MSEHLTHKATDSEIDHTFMSLIGQPDENTVTVCFGKNTEDTSTMPLSVYDKMTEGENWESQGFVAI